MRLSQATTINVCMYLTKEFGFLESFDKRKIGFKMWFCIFFFVQKHHFFVLFLFQPFRRLTIRQRCGKGVSV